MKRPAARPATAAAASERTREGRPPAARSPAALAKVLLTGSSSARGRRLLLALLGLFALLLRPRLVAVLLLLALALALGGLRVVLEVLGLAELDVGLEAREVGLHGSLHEAQPGRHLLDHALRDEVHVDHDARELVVELME